MSPFIGESTTNGAVMRSCRRPATKVVTFQWPFGTLATSRCPRRQRPRSRVMLVEVPVSSTKMSLGLRVGPFAQAGLNEAFGLAIGFGCVGFGADVAQAELLASTSEGEGFIAGTVVGHHALDLDAEPFVIGDRGPEEGDGAAPLLVRHDLGKGDARVIVDADVDVFPSNTAAVALAALARLARR